MTRTLVIVAVLILTGCSEQLLCEPTAFKAGQLVKHRLTKTEYIVTRDSFQMGGCFTPVRGHAGQELTFYNEELDAVR